MAFGSLEVKGAPELLRLSDRSGTGVTNGRPVGAMGTLIIITSALIGIGILMVYSASFNPASSRESYFFARHIVFVPLALGMMFLVMCVNVKVLNNRWVALGLLVTVLFLLVAVLLVNSGHIGTRRWFRIRVASMDLGIQASEVAKIGIVIFLAWLFSRRGAEAGGFLKSFVPAAAAIGMVCGLIAIADFGTATLVAVVAVVMCLLGGVRLRHLAVLVPPGLVGIYFLLWRVPYRRERLLSFLNPWADLEGSGWHAVQSLLAIGSGGLFGLGLGNGMQKLGYLPEATTDFIFAIICEEMGIIGGLLVLLLFAAFVWQAGRIACSANDRFSSLLAAGIALMIGLQAVMNMAVVMVAIPTKGIALPFISYGGSSLVMTAASVGLLLAVAHRSTASKL